MGVKLLFSVVLFLLLFPVQAASLAEGIIYLKGGKRIEYSGDDRIYIPKKNRNVKAFRNAFSKSKQKEVYPIAEIDSIVCWHRRTPAYRRKFIPATDVGWCWVYFRTPHILACVYAGKGYGIDSNGGICIWQRKRIFSSSCVKYYLQKKGETVFYSPGKMKSRTGNAFRERLCYYLSDDAALCGRIRRSDTWRGKTVLMLKEYSPGN